MGEIDWGGNGLVLMGGAMLSKSLIQFSVEDCVPSLSFDLRPNYGGGNEDNGDLLQKVPCTHCYTQCPQPCSRPQPAGWITANCGNSSRGGNTRPPDLPLEKPVCRSGSNSQNWTWNNRLVPNRERSMPRLYIDPAYLTYMQSTSWEMLNWMKHKLKSITRRNINNLRHADGTALIAEGKKIKRAS